MAPNQVKLTSNQLEMLTRLLGHHVSSLDSETGFGHLYTVLLEMCKKEAINASEPLPIKFHEYGDSKIIVLGRATK